MQSNFVEHRLRNGLRVVCELMPRASSAAVAFFVQTGSRHETPELHGVSHFLEHMCFKGSERRNCHEINVRFDELGSIYNAFTSKEHTVYYGWVPAERLAEQIDLLADVVQPILPAEDFETERKVILEEIAMGDDSFDRHISNFLHRAAFDDHPLAHEILGEKETIAALPRDAMQAYHRSRYSPSNMVVLAAGAIEPEALFTEIERHCGRWSPSPNGQPVAAPRPLPTGVRKLRLEQFQQQSIVLLYPSVPDGHPHEESIEAFASLFGGHNSRCYWNIVQKGICAQAGAVWISYRDCGMMALFADGEPARCQEMLEALEEQAREITKTSFRPDEVQRVKNQRRTHLALEGESPRTRLMQIMDDVESRGRPQTRDERLAAVNAVSEETIAAYLREFPITGDPLLLSIGPRDWP